MSLWRQTGFSYLKYSQIAARTLRKCVKGETKALIGKRDDKIAIKVTKWIDGKPTVK